MPQEITWPNFLLLMGSGGIGGATIMLFLLKWLRYKPLDAMNVAEKRAKINQIKVETDSAIVTEALKLVATLREQLETLRTRYDSLQEDLDKEREVLNEERRKHEETQLKLANSQTALNLIQKRVEDCEKRLRRR